VSDGELSPILDDKHHNGHSATSKAFHQGLDHRRAETPGLDVPLERELVAVSDRQPLGLLESEHTSSRTNHRPRSAPDDLGGKTAAKKLKQVTRMTAVVCRTPICQAYRQPEGDWQWFSFLFVLLYYKVVADEC
jgi:hypothetical protein